MIASLTESSNHHLANLLLKISFEEEKRDVASPKRATKWAMNLNNSKYHWETKKDVKLLLWKEPQSGFFISIADAMMPLRESLFSNWDGVESTVGPLYEVALIKECKIRGAFHTSAACQYFQYNMAWVLNLTWYHTSSGSTKDTLELESF